MAGSTRTPSRRRHRSVPLKGSTPRRRKPTPATPPDDFGLSPEREAYWEGRTDAAELARINRREGVSAPKVPEPASTRRSNGPRAAAPPRRAPARAGAPARRRSSSRTARPTLADPTGGRASFLSFDGDGLAGIFMGGVFYALVLSIADYGASGPGLWFKAKFLNEPAPAKGKAP